MTDILELARAHVIQAERLVTRQERLVETLRRKRASTRIAEEILLTLRGTLKEMREHLAYEEAKSQES